MTKSQDSAISRRTLFAFACGTAITTATGCVGRRSRITGASATPTPATQPAHTPPSLCLTPSQTPASPRSTRILLENQKPGTADWRPFRTAEELPFGAYLSHSSIGRGDQVQLFASARRATSCTLEVFRLGYYGGAGARRLLSREGVAVPAQGWWTPTTGVQEAPRARFDPATGLFDCNWEPVATIAPTPDWLSGYYIVRLTDPAGFHGGACFVLRDDEQPGNLIVQSAAFTRQAYNGWGGKSLYEYTSTNPSVVLGKTRAVKVSFNRPYTRTSGFPEFLSYEPDFVRWVEWMGKDVTYATDLDLHRRQPAAARGLLCLGHDEYWTAEMVDHALAARDAGVHLAFLGGNMVYWQIRLEADAQGAVNRTIVCYKRAESDPARADPRAVTVRFVDPAVNRPQSLLTGTTYGSELAPFTQDWVAARDHWLLAGTGLRPGDRIKDLVGREFDQLGPSAITPANLEVIASSPVSDAHGGHGVASSTIYTASSGALVFCAGTVHWNRGLVSGRASFDPRVGQITANLLNRFVAR